MLNFIDAERNAHEALTKPKYVKKNKVCPECMSQAFSGDMCLECGLDIDSRFIPHPDTVKDVIFRRENKIHGQLINWCEKEELAPFDTKLIIIYKTCDEYARFSAFAFKEMSGTMYTYRAGQHFISKTNVLAWAKWELPTLLIDKTDE